MVVILQLQSLLSFKIFLIILYLKIILSMISCEKRYAKLLWLSVIYSISDIFEIVFQVSLIIYLSRYLSEESIWIRYIIFQFNWPDIRICRYSLNGLCINFIDIYYTMNLINCRQSMIHVRQTSTILNFQFHYVKISWFCIQSRAISNKLCWRTRLINIDEVYNVFQFIKL